MQELTIENVVGVLLVLIILAYSFKSMYGEKEPAIDIYYKGKTLFLLENLIYHKEMTRDDIELIVGLGCSYTYINCLRKRHKITILENRQGTVFRFIEMTVPLYRTKRGSITKKITNNII